MAEHKIHCPYCHDWHRVKSVGPFAVAPCEQVKRDNPTDFMFVEGVRVGG